MDKNEIINELHIECVRNGSSKFTYQEIIDILERIESRHRCDGCMGSTFGDCEGCER